MVQSLSSESSLPFFLFNLLFLLVFVCRFLQFYFEFHVHIMVMPSGFKSGAHNIVTNAVWDKQMSWKFGVGRKGGYRGTPIKEGTLFFSRIYTLSEFCGILGLPIGVAPHYKMGSCWLCGSRMWHFRQQPSLHSRPSIVDGRVKNRHHSAWCTNLSRFFLLYFYFSCFYLAVLYFLCLF